MRGSPVLLPAGSGALIPHERVRHAVHMAVALNDSLNEMLHGLLALDGMGPTLTPALAGWLFRGHGTAFEEFARVMLGEDQETPSDAAPG